MAQPVGDYVFTSHATFEMARRRISEGTAHAVLALPEQRHRVVKATYNARTNTLSIVFKADVEIAESDEDEPGVILDYDADGNPVSLEILDGSQRVGETRRIEFEMVE